MMWAGGALQDDSTAVSSDPVVSPGLPRGSGFSGQDIARPPLRYHADPVALHKTGWGAPPKA